MEAIIKSLEISLVGERRIGFYYRQGLILAVSAILLWLLFDYTQLDMQISQMFFAKASATWPYYDNYFVRTLGYDVPKYLLVVYGTVLLALLLYSYKCNYWRGKRRILFFLLLSLIIVPVEIAAIKQTFYKPRPSQVIEFGGNLPHVKLTQFVSDSTASNWPGGHASGGAALLSLYFVGCHMSAKWKYRGIYFGLAASQFMGFIQVMRGQHFFSHNLWTVWFAWLTLTVLYFLLFEYKSKANAY